MPDQVIERLPPLSETQLKNRPTGFYFPDDAVVFYGAKGQVFHRIVKGSEGGTVMEVDRPLAQRIEDARNNGWDFYDPELGLIWNGYKLASDRSVADRLKDTSETQLRPGAALPA